MMIAIIIVIMIIMVIIMMMKYIKIMIFINVMIPNDKLCLDGRPSRRFVPDFSK